MRINRQIAAVQALAIPIAGEFIAAGLESVVAVCTVKLVGKIGVKAGLKGVKQACSASASTLESSSKRPRLRPVTTQWQ